MNIFLNKLLLTMFFLSLFTFCKDNQDKLFESVSQKSHEAVTPVPHTRVEVADWWMLRHDANNKRLSEGNVDILFIGNSIIMGWEGPGRKIWNEYYENRNSVNMGFGWDRTQHVLWRIDNADFSKISPKLAIVLIGTNNIGINSPEEIADGIIAICGRVRNKLPETKILLLAIFPRDPEPSTNREDAARASLLASKIADGKMIHFMDIGDIFLNDNKSLRNDLMPDFLHPNEAGYKIWAETIESKVSALYD